MQQRLTTSPDFHIRPLETQDERNAFYRLAIQTFNPYADVETALPRRRGFVEGSPAFQLQRLRGAFLGTTFLGGYHIDERYLCISPSRLLTGCIGSVVTLSEHRLQGVAAMLLRDALTYAQEHAHALLLLDGIPNFYHRFGFIDVFDKVEHTIDRNLVLDLPVSPYRIRAATPDDVPALLELYQRHYCAYIGSFERDAAYQALLYNYRSSTKPLLALDSNNVLRGYLMLSKRPEGFQAFEAAADDKDAALALLQEHAALNKQLDEQGNSLSWPLPLDSQTYYVISDHIRTQSHVTVNPNADWMARTAHLSTLIEALLPLWNQRWHANSAWSGTLAFIIDGNTYLLGIDEHNVYLLDPMTSSTHAAHQIRLSQQVFTQLLFGYRSISWAAKQPGQSIPNAVHAVLDVLFPTGHAWIAGTDAF